MFATPRASEQYWDKLQHLRDIHLPEAPGWLPLAPGWWMLILLICMTVAVLASWSRRRRRYRAPIVHALAELNHLHTQASELPPGARNAFPASCNALLKRVARLRCRQESNIDPALLHGQAWRDFLRKTSDWNTPPPPEALVSGPYMPEPDMDIDNVKTWTAVWLRHQGTRS